jgi:hypothetical protein
VRVSLYNEIEMSIGVVCVSNSLVENTKKGETSPWRCGAIVHRSTSRCRRWLDPCLEHPQRVKEEASGIEHLRHVLIVGVEAVGIESLYHVVVIREEAGGSGSSPAVADLRLEDMRGKRWHHNSGGCAGAHRY